MGTLNMYLTIALDQKGSSCDGNSRIQRPGVESERADRKAERGP